VVESLATIKEEAGRLADLLNSYLGLVRPESSVGLVDLRELCGRVRQLIAFSARRSRVEIRQAGDAEGPVVRGVGDRLQQAIVNLTLNALQAMPDGGVLTLETGREPGWAHVRVSDTGPGVPVELRGRLFESTWTTKPGGRGLGLPLVRMIAEAHGGHVRYGEAGGGGAMFTLLLPLARGE
jgi:signal transduction histidine kinase